MQCEYEYTKREFKNALEEIYEEIVCDARPVIEPRAVLLGGQSGSGKTTIHKIEREQNPNVVIINGDTYRTSHPQFERIRQEKGDDFVKYTQEFANSVSNALIERLSNEGYNLIIEGTLRTTEVPLASLELLKNKGYTVELAVMATYKEISWKGTLERYNEMLAKGCPARATERKIHDTIVKNIVSNISELYKMKVFDNIVLYDREEKCLYNMKNSPDIDPSEILYNKINYNKGYEGEKIRRKQAIKDNEYIDK